jgi:hypothetical protein
MRYMPRGAGEITIRQPQDQCVDALAVVMLVGLDGVCRNLRSTCFSMELTAHTGLDTYSSEGMWEGPAPRSKKSADLVQRRSTLNHYPMRFSQP